jgi:molybdopterin-guanine dinucleotide biosynthesis protein A
VTSPVSGIVLAGGRSRRLGVDKRSLYLNSNRTQLAETIDRLATVVDDVIVAGDPLEIVSRPVTVVADVDVGVGPLAGLVAGLSAVRHDHAIVLACDLPFLNVDLLRGLLALPRDYVLLVPCRSDGTLEMLHAVYSRSIVETLQKYLNSGQRRLSGLPAALERAGLVVRTVNEDWLRQFDPTLRSFFNLNTPTDLERARAELRRTDFLSPAPHSPRLL